MLLRKYLGCSDLGLIEVWMHNTLINSLTRCKHMNLLLWFKLRRYYHLFKHLGLGSFVLLLLKLLLLMNNSLWRVQRVGLVQDLSALLRRYPVVLIWLLLRCYISDWDLLLANTSSCVQSCIYKYVVRRDMCSWCTRLCKDAKCLLFEGDVGSTCNRLIFHVGPIDSIWCLTVVKLFMRAKFKLRLMFAISLVY